MEGRGRAVARGPEASLVTAVFPPILSTHQGKTPDSLLLDPGKGNSLFASVFHDSIL